MRQVAAGTWVRQFAAGALLLAGACRTQPINDPPAPTYHATWLGGGIDTVELFQADVARNLCLRLFVLAGGGFGKIAVSGPPGWGVSNANVTNAAAFCDGTVADTGDTIHVTAGSGAIAFGPKTVSRAPCTLDVKADLTLDFAQWAPASVHLDALKVPVAGPCHP